MKYSNRRNYRDQIIVEEEIITKKTVVKKKEKSLLKSLLNKFIKNK